MRFLIVALLATGCLSKPGPPGGDDDTTTVPSVDSLLGVGDDHACAIDSAKQLWCWGKNDDGELGTMNPTPVTTPVRVGTETGWTAVAAGSTHSCGIINGEARCWGDGGNSQTNGGTHPEDHLEHLDGFVPVRVFARDAGTCMLDAAGHLMCWGEPSIVATSAIPVDPGGKGLAFDLVAFNSDHGCALTVDHVAYCWGANDYGQLGAGEVNHTLVLPEAALPRDGTSYISIAVQGSTTCGITSGHAIECWGVADSALFADKKDQGHDTSTSTIVDTSRAWSTLSMHDSFACANASGAAYCWGYSNSGQLGDGYDYHDIVAAPVLHDALGVTTGNDYTCAHDTSGAVYCWGQNRYGNLGNGEVARVTEPVVVLTAPDVANRDQFYEIAVGQRHACALLHDSGQVYCWGDNRAHQVDPDPTDHVTTIVAPQLVPNLTATHISTGRDHTCAVQTDRNVRCWGSNMFLQLGSTTPEFFDQTIAGPFTWVSAGAVATCGVRNGDITCWGNVPGQDQNLAVGSTIIPKNTAPWLEVEVGDDHAIATDDTQVIAWGTSCAATGVATGGRTTASSPPVITGLPAGTTDVAAGINGGGGSCVSVTVAGSSDQLQCWGSNYANQLTSGDTADCVPKTTVRLPEIPVAGPDPGHRGGKLSLAGGHGCALNTDSSVECWGEDFEREIGPPTGLAANKILKVFGTAKWDRFATGSTVTCAIAATGSYTVSCWGTSFYGELGNGRRFQDKPVKALIGP